MFVKTGYFNGTNLANLLSEVGSPETFNPNNAVSVLNHLVVQKELTNNLLDLSEIFTDRIAAGLEIISPQITTQNLTLENLTPLSNNLTLNLTDNGQFIINNNEASPSAIISFDNQGNAYFAGTIIADKIKASQILGLEIFTDKISSLSGQLDNLAGISTTPTNTPKQDEDTIFTKLVSFIGDVIFKGKISFEKNPEFNKDTAGFALIKKGEKKVEVKFEKEFTDIPIININPIWDLEKETASVADQIEGFFPYIPRYIITNLSKSGFTIILEDKAVTDLKFSWVALSVNQPKTYESVNSQTLLENLLSPTLNPISITPTLFLSPIPTETPTIPPTPTPTLFVSQTDSTSSISSQPSIINNQSSIITVLPNELGFLRLRAAPSVNSEELAQIPIGTSLTSLELNNDWYKVRYNNIEGWLSGAFIEKN